MKSYDIYLALTKHPIPHVEVVVRFATGMRGGSLAVRVPKSIINLSDRTIVDDLNLYPLQQKAQ